MVQLSRSRYKRIQIVVLMVMAYFASAFVPVEAYAIKCWQKQASQLGADLWQVPVPGGKAIIRLDIRDAALASLGVKMGGIGDDFTTIGVPNNAAGKVIGFLKVADRSGEITNNPVIVAYYFLGTLAIVSTTEPKIFMVVRKGGETECKQATGNEEEELAAFFKENNLTLVADSAIANSDDAVGAVLGFGMKIPAREPEKAPTAGEPQVREGSGPDNEFTPEVIDAIDDAIMGQ